MIGFRGASAITTKNTAVVLKTTARILQLEKALAS